MSEAKPEDISGKRPHPLSQVGISSLIIGIANFFSDDPELLKGAALSAPLSSSGAVELIKLVRKGRRLKEVCAVLDSTIADKEAELSRSGVSRNRRNEITAEIDRLKQLKLDQRLAHIEVKIKKE